MKRILIVASFLAVGAVVVGLLALRPDSCDGLPRSIGACDSDRPEFTGTTCQEVALEWGTEMNERVLTVIGSPETVRGQSWSSRLYDVETLVSQLANLHMRETGLTPDCDAGDFLTRGAMMFSDEVREDVGDFMYDGNPVVEYEEWKSRLVGWVDLMLDLELEAPLP